MWPSLLNPIPGTPLSPNRNCTIEKYSYRGKLPVNLAVDASIRLAGGRGLLGDKGESCFQSGANAAISGDMLTTAGITVETDMRLLKELGYEVRYGK